MANACRDCYVLVVQDSNSIDGEPLHHITHQLPWVDLAASTNVPGYDDGSTGRYARASRHSPNQAASFSPPRATRSSFR